MLLQQDFKGKNGNEGEQQHACSYIAVFVKVASVFELQIGPEM